MKFRLIILTVFLFTTSVFANLRDDQIRFKYASFDGQIVHQCTHKKINEWYDWEVNCADKVFSAHISLKKHFYEIQPKTIYEIMFWITNKTNPTKLDGTGSTIWVELNKQSDYSKITVSQSTEADTAGLFLYITP